MATAQTVRLERLIVFAALLEFLALFAIPLYAIPFHIPLNYNEGWNAYLAQAAMAGTSLYPAADAMTANNYPPLSFYMVGAVGRVIGDNIVAGRLISVLSLMVMGINMFRLSRWLGADRRLAALSGCIALLGLFTLMPGYMAMDDPQFLAHAFITSAAVLFLTTPESDLWRGMMLSALLMAIGGLVKHSVISLPLALCTWAAFQDRRRLAVFIWSAMLVGLVLGLAAYLLWGQAMIRDIFLSPRLTWLARSIALGRVDLRFLWPYIIVFAVASVLLRDKNRRIFILSYVLWSLVNAFWMLAGDGVNQNVMCDVITALSLGAILAVLAITDLAPQSQRWGDRVRLLALTVAALPWMVTGVLSYLLNPAALNIATVLDEPKWAALISTLHQSHGPVACETLALCYWAQKPIEIDFFNYGQKINNGAVYIDAPNGFLAKVVSKQYAYVVLEQSGLIHGRLPPFMVQAVMNNYQPSQLTVGELVMARNP